MLVAVVLLVLFIAAAYADGFYFHLYRYRLHARPEARREHLLHTVNACLLVPQVYAMFCARPGPAALAAAAALSLATLAVELADVLCEKASRRALGGLTSAEYALHFLMSGFRMGFVGAFFAAAFVASPTVAPAVVAFVGWCVVVPGIAIAALHLGLLFAGRRALAPAG
jgi:hypothetical protein